ncbi:MAG: ComEC/Rec2 family competence protein [Mycoplasmataceae bacterium]|nr:ComEC/Rec2 family competence protein [Mycoplasmataceae bacterium]
MKISKASWQVYDLTKQLSIVYLLCVGGLQVSFLKILVSKVCVKRNIANCFNIIIIGFYTYILGFSSGILRVFLSLIFSICFHKWLKKYDILALSGIFTIFIEPSCVFNYGFCLSYLCTYLVMYIYDLGISNIFLEQLLINVGCCFISLPFVTMMDKQISISSFIIGIGFAYIFIFLYLWYILTIWFVFLSPIHSFFANTLIFILEGCLKVNWSVNVLKFTNVFFVIFYLLSYFLFVWIEKTRYQRIKAQILFLLNR